MQGYALHETDKGETNEKDLEAIEDHQTENDGVAGSALSLPCDAVGIGEYLSRDSAGGAGQRVAARHCIGDGRGAEVVRHNK